MDAAQTRELHGDQIEQFSLLLFIFISITFLVSGTNI